jgi:hypothetical protein
MGTSADHRKCAEECVAMARAAGDDRDKALWLTLAQSWVRLADHVARDASKVDDGLSIEAMFALQSPENA